MLCTNYRLTITFGNLYFTKENFGSKYFKILTYKILHVKSNTSTLLSLKVKVKYYYFPVKPYIKEICSVINLISLTTGR